MEDYFMNLIEDLMPPAPTLWKQCDKKSVQSDMREFNLLEDTSLSMNLIPANTGLSILPLS